MTVARKGASSRYFWMEPSSVVADPDGCRTVPSAIYSVTIGHRRGSPLPDLLRRAVRSVRVMDVA